VPKLRQGKARSRAWAGEACLHSGGGGGGRGSRFRHAVGRALPSLCLAAAVLLAATVAVTKPVVSGGKAWRRAEASSFNHSPPPRPPLHAVPRCRSPRPGIGTATAVAAGKASERTKASAGRRGALLDCSPRVGSCLSVATATASIASERTKGAGLRSFARYRSRESQQQLRVNLPWTGFWQSTV
jgi:hypothetical protein